MKPPLCPITRFLALILITLYSGTTFAAMIHDYEFNGNLNDNLGGASLVGNGILSPTETGYTFSALQLGPRLTDNVNFSVNPSTYTMSMSFKIADAVGSYEKILDYKNRTSDNGIYRYPSSGSNTLGFYNYGAGTTLLAQNVLYRVTITRNGLDKYVKGYVHDGTNFTTSFSFIDNSDYGVISAANTLWFLTDDTTTTSEQCSGYINQIMIYNDALSVSSVQALGGPKGISPIPEPHFLGLMFVGFCAILIRSWKMTRRLINQKSPLC